MRFGIRLIHGRPRHPQPRGKVERFHRTLKADVFAGRQFADLVEVQHACDAFRDIYNHRRPHEAVRGHRPPGIEYDVSPRPFPKELPEPTYADDAAVRKVAAQGTISYQGRRIRLNKGLEGMHVGVYPTEVDSISVSSSMRPHRRRWTCIRSPRCVCHRVTHVSIHYNDGPGTTRPGATCQPH